jgi:hypothetical protein
VSTSANETPAAQQDAPLLDVRDLIVHHGQLRALSGISRRVFPGEVYAIIGANGAGKSTLLRTIAGLHHPTEGSIVYDGRDVTGLRPEKRATAGIVMVPEGRRLFPSLTLEENLQVGATFARSGPWTIEKVYDLFPWMKERRRQKTSQMSGGEQQSPAWSAASGSRGLPGDLFLFSVVRTTENRNKLVRVSGEEQTRGSPRQRGGDHGRRGLPARAEGSRRQPAVRERGHRLRAPRRGVRSPEAIGTGFPRAGRLRAREPRHLDGARRLPG